MGLSYRGVAIFQQTYGSVISAVTTSTLIFVFLLQKDFLPNIVLTIYSLTAAMAFLLMIILLAAIYENARQIERFDDYKAEFEKRWGTIE